MLAGKSALEDNSALKENSVLADNSELEESQTGSMLGEFSNLHEDYVVRGI